MVMTFLPFEIQAGARAEHVVRPFRRPFCSDWTTGAAGPALSALEDHHLTRRTSNGLPTCTSAEAADVHVSWSHRYALLVESIGPMCPAAGRPRPAGPALTV